MFTDDVIRKYEAYAAKRERNPYLGLGSFLLALKEVRTVSKAESRPTTTGQMADVVNMLGYVFVFRVLESTSQQNPVGMDVDVYFRQNADKQWQRDNDMGDLIACAGTILKGAGFAYNGETSRGFLASPCEARGFVVRCHTQAKDGTEYLYKNWTPVPQTLDQIKKVIASLV